MTKRTSRLAPSPTGALHLGNIRTFLVNWALARQGGWTLVMRMEDLDGPRIKPEAAKGTLEALRWLGMDWDGEVLQQTEDLAPYRDAMARLAADGLVYPCQLSRKQVEAAASAPHEPDEPIRTATTTGPIDFQLHQDTNYRFRIPEKPVVIADQLAGETVHDLQRDGGDFVVWTKTAIPAYQLAVVVDDGRQAVTDVVRGDDLLASAARQSLLQAALGLDEPTWWHLPLVIGEDGRRLAKRHGDTRIDRYRADGISGERIIGLMGFWCGLSDERVAMSITEFLDQFQITSVGPRAIVYTAQDEQWLRQ